MKEFFENLREIRKKKNLSLEDISRRSHLSLKYLEDIENGKLEDLPQGYDRIFFKRYLKEIGEDKEDVWRDFNLFFGTGPLENEKVPYSSDIPIEDKMEEAGPEDEPPQEEKPSLLQELTLRWNLDKLHKYFWIALTVVVLGIVGFFAYRQFIFVKNNQLTVKEITISDLIEEMQRQDSLATPKMSRNTSVTAGNEGVVNVQLRALQRTWIREIRDKEDTTDYIMPAGLTRKIDAQQSVQLMLGRADGVDINLNGQDLGTMGSADEIVLKLTLTGEGITEKRIKKSSKPAVTNDTTTVTSAHNSAPADTSGVREGGQIL